KSPSPWMSSVAGSPDHSFACFNPVGNESERPVLVISEAEGVASLARADARMVEIADRTPILEIDHLVKEFSVTAGAIVQRKIGTVKAVSDVTFSVREGETFGLVGESGCGKTTIGRLIVGLEHP